MKISAVSPEIGKFVEDVKNAFNDRLRDNSGQASQPPASAAAVKRAILTVLSDGAKSGTEVITTISAASAGAWSPADSDVYPVLQDLTDASYLNFDVIDGKKTYLITDAGRSWLAENPEVGHSSDSSSTAGGSTGSFRDWSNHKIKAKADLAKASVQLGQAVAAVASNGSVDKLQRAQTVVEDASKAVFAILGEANN